MNYVVVIPAKNEQTNIAVTLSFLAGQTLAPKCILVIDDNSTDNTARVIKEYAARYPFIRYYHYPGEKKYVLGSKIVKIFNEGKRHIDQLGIEYDYIVKLDADNHLSNNIFEKIALSIQDKNYGIVSPLAFSWQNGKVIYTSTPDWHTIGDFKIYNKVCYEKMGGLIEDLGWDCADNITAMEAGYKTQVLRHIHYENRRPVGRFSLLKGRKRQGIGAFKLRYSILYLILKTVHDLFRPPVLLGSFYYLFGYFAAMFQQQPRILTPPQGKMLRRLLWESFRQRFHKRQFFLLQYFPNGKSKDVVQVKELA